jgi:hypothetical protein
VIVAGVAINVARALVTVGGECRLLHPGYGLPFLVRRMRWIDCLAALDAYRLDVGRDRPGLRRDVERERAQANPGLRRPCDRTVGGGRRGRPGRRRSGGFHRVGRGARWGHDRVRTATACVGPTCGGACRCRKDSGTHHCGEDRLTNAHHAVLASAATFRVQPRAMQARRLAVPASESASWPAPYRPSRLAQARMATCPELGPNC